MSELLLECFTEEIPALMQKKAEEAYADICLKYFKENDLESATIEVFIGPRRLTIYATGMPGVIKAKEIEVKGPRIDASEAAIEGFCRTNNITRSELSQKLIKDQVCFIYVNKTPPMAVKDLLGKLLPEIIGQYVWPKSMYWGRYSIKWVRPLKNILCLLDGEILPIKFGHLTANNITYGHRFMTASKEIKPVNFADYKKQLAENYVILSRRERCSMIENGLNQVAQSENLNLKADPFLLEEVTGLAEYPQVMPGKIPEKYLILPREVLITSMRTHQKYFSLYDKQGNFAPYFLFVSNIASQRPDIIVEGNEKVLSARLADALYFYNQDLSQKLADRTVQLEKIVFHAKAGSLKAKTERIVKICSYLSGGNAALEQAAQICKSDLLTEMVGEFPELQGIMGYYYATQEGLGEEVGMAIRDHYKPQGPSDNVPTGAAALLALADKIDSLVVLWIAGEQPSGSKDPYALRRQALGIIRIILENALPINLKDLIAKTAELYESTLHPAEENISGIIYSSLRSQILLFLEERAKFHFKNKYEISLINAVLDLENESNLAILELKLASLTKFLSTAAGEILLTSYKRINNILAGEKMSSVINQELFITDFEKELYKFTTELSVQIEAKIAEEDFVTALTLLGKIQIPIANFFDNILVKDEKQEVANNRLLLLQSLKILFHKIARFDLL